MKAAQKAERTAQLMVASMAGSMVLSLVASKDGLMVETMVALKVGGRDLR